MRLGMWSFSSVLGVRGVVSSEKLLMSTSHVGSQVCVLIIVIEPREGSS